MTAHQNTLKEQIARDQRRVRVLRLHRLGKSLREIGRLLDVSKDTAGNDIKWWRKKWQKKCMESIDEKMADELGKLNSSEEALWMQWETTKDLRIISEIRQIVLTRMKLFGLDNSIAPESLLRELPEIRVRIRKTNADGSDTGA